MTQQTLFSIIETPNHPNFPAIYTRLKLGETKYTAMRQAIAGLKKSPPDFIVAEFIYGFSNNYAGINISNLDVMLFSLKKYAPEAKVIVLVDKAQRQYVDKLNEIYPLHRVLVQPVSEQHLISALTE